MMMEESEARRAKQYPTIIERHNNIQFFAPRVELLKSINSPHMFLIQVARLAKHPIIFYQQPVAAHSLATLISSNAELLPSEIKALIWQFTKFMLHCQALHLSHLRLTPSAIVLSQKWEPGKPIFIRVKDFSLGKEFLTVDEGKVLDFFSYLHPDLSIGNKTADYTCCQPGYDIWSLGVILYELIYKRSPFRKEGREIFSKTILRDFLSKNYQVYYLNSKFSSINKFISRCFAAEGGFQGWEEVMGWTVAEEEIYNQLDFYDGPIGELAQMHLRLMALFSGIYCMIIEQCKNSPHPFWHKPISLQKKQPFHLMIAQFTLRLMKIHEDRFHRLYQPYLQLIRHNSTKEALMMVSKKLEVELAHMGKQWREEKFGRPQFTLETVRAIQEVCAKVELQLSQLDPQRNSYKEIKGARKNTFGTRKLWKSMQILRTYCGEVIYILNQCKNRMKYIYEQFYLSTILEAILLEDFEYKGTLPITIEHILKRSRI